MKLKAIVTNATWTCAGGTLFAGGPLPLEIYGIIWVTTAATVLIMPEATPPHRRDNDRAEDE